MQKKTVLGLRFDLQVMGLSLEQSAECEALNDIGYRTMSAIRDLLFWTPFHMDDDIKEYFNEPAVKSTLQVYQDCPFIKHLLWYSQKLN